MYATIRLLIEQECKKHIRRYHEKLAVNISNEKKFERRTGLVAKKKFTKQPPIWQLDNQFNPFYVLSNIDTISYTISKKIKSQTYEPKPCLIQPIPKQSGGTRKISIFTIPDSVVAKYLYATLLKRNFAVFSAYAYAYRTDRNAHNAIEHLYQSLKDNDRCFIVEYDFSQYFDTIDHSYLTELLKTNLKVSSREIYLIKQLLSYKKAEGVKNYKSNLFVRNTVGIPQGSSISLFLANIACLELDKKIEKEGGVFARFSDDSVIICNTYEKAHRCAGHMISHGDRSGTKINFTKSDGISLLTEETKAEIRSKTNFAFLGHTLSGNIIGLRPKTLKKIKTRISEIINRHLIHYPKKYKFASSRYSHSTKVDWDLVTCINDLRRYIYGNISEAKLSACLTNKSEPLKFVISTMSFYPLVNDEKIFKSLDGWLIHSLDQALKKREAILKRYIRGYQRITKQSLLADRWFKGKPPQETKIPSFFKAWLYTKKLVKVYGIQKFPNPEYY